MELLKLVQRRVANVAIGASTLRNQGAGGVANAAREFLADLEIEELGCIEPTEYKNKLDCWTEELIKKLPDGAQNWGTARKAINVFMVEVFFNKHLALQYKLEKFKDNLETPLDSKAVKIMKTEAGRGKLPRWCNIKRLTPEISHEFQEYARKLAEKWGLSRAELDLKLWSRD